MRIVKEASVRRNEILDAAEQLFVTKGFDETSTNDILEQVGIARGTLYYHFKSKEKILDAMIRENYGNASEKSQSNCRAEGQSGASQRLFSKPSGGFCAVLP